MERYTVSPTDLLEAEVLLDEIRSELRALSRGMKSLRRSYTTSCAGLKPAVRSVASLAAKTEECWLLLSYVAERSGRYGPEASPSASTDYTPYSKKSGNLDGSCPNCNARPFARCNRVSQGLACNWPVPLEPGQLPYIYSASATEDCKD
jgi:hypothetical protein